MSDRKKEVEVFLKKLKSRKRNERSEAAEALALYNIKEVVYALKKALRDDDAWEVRKASAISLGCIGKNAVIATSELIFAIENDSDEDVSFWSGWALIKIGSPDNLPLVYTLFEKINESEKKFTLAYEIISNFGKEQKAISIIEDLISNQELSVDMIKLYREMFSITNFKEIVEEASDDFTSKTTEEIQESIKSISEKLDELGITELLEELVERAQKEKANEREILQRMYDTLDQRRIILSRYVSKNMFNIEKSQERIAFLEMKINSLTLVIRNILIIFSFVIMIFIIVFIVIQFLMF